MKIQVQVKPNSRQESVEVIGEASVVVRVNAPPVEGRANARVIELLAEHFGVPKSRVSLDRGAKGKHKIFVIEDL